MRMCEHLYVSFNSFTSSELGNQGGALLFRLAGRLVQQQIVDQQLRPLRQQELNLIDLVSLVRLAPSSRPR